MSNMLHVQISSGIEMSLVSSGSSLYHILLSYNSRLIAIIYEININGIFNFSFTAKDWNIAQNLKMLLILIFIITGTQIFMAQKPGTIDFFIP